MAFFKYQLAAPLSRFCVRLSLESDETQRQNTVRYQRLHVGNTFPRWISNNVHIVYLPCVQLPITPITQIVL